MDLAMTLRHGCIVNTDANNLYKSSPAPIFRLCSFMPSTSANTKDCFQQVISHDYDIYPISMFANKTIVHT